MNRIKLDAIDSTNDFLKKLSSADDLENFTVVTAENQTNGKGQMGAKWDSESGKNLIMSVLVKDFLTDNNQLFSLNMIFSIAVIDALKSFEIPNFSIKWPNDILSGNKKIGGILIENSIKSDGSITSVIGLGLNVNQTNFQNLPKASSLKLICDRHFDKEALLETIITNLFQAIQLWKQAPLTLHKNYVENLFKKGIPMPFENRNGQRFMGMISGITPEGKLQILREDDSVAIFELKEISMLY